MGAEPTSFRIAAFACALVACLLLALPALAKKPDPERSDGPPAAQQGNSAGGSSGGSDGGKKAGNGNGNGNGKQQAGGGSSQGGGGGSGETKTQGNSAPETNSGPSPKRGSSGKKNRGNTDARANETAGSGTGGNRGGGGAGGRSDAATGNQQPPATGSRGGAGSATPAPRPAAQPPARTRRTREGARDGAGRARRTRDGARSPAAAEAPPAPAPVAAGVPAVPDLEPLASVGGAGTRLAKTPESPAGSGPAAVLGDVGDTVERVVDAAPVPVQAALALLALLALAFGLNALWVGMRARRLARQREQLLDEVGLLQAALLPDVPERLGELVSTVAYRPAEGPAAGGDFYDAFAFDAGKVGVIVGDISGHGRDALARTALLRYTLRAYMDAGLEPRAALKVAGSVLDDDLGSDFATVAVAVYDPAAGTLTYACAGHPPPIVLGPAGHEPVTASSSPPIGTGATTGLRQTTVSLPAGSVACFYTDGMTEARVGDDLLGRERLAELLEGLGPDVTAPELLERVSEVAERIPDDMAACILHSESGSPGSVRVEELEVARADLASGAVERFLRSCGVAVAELPAAVNGARKVAAEAGSAVLRVRLGDWRPGVDVLPGNIETIAGARRIAARAGS